LGMAEKGILFFISAKFSVVVVRVGASPQQ
jgi:hypothetical protein